ncbi:MAG TPA: DUF3418 domain-containing protein, partial [Ilumatobacteraceae bacterium]|nr:DUF3418 domain-containing protein [Ilumatobacteraceae bacterium]
SIRLLSRPDLQQRAMPGGVHRLVRLGLSVSPRLIERALSGRAKLDIAASGLGFDAVADDCVAAAVDAIIADSGIPWDQTAFDGLAVEARRRVPLDAVELALLAASAAGQAVALRRRLATMVADTQRPIVDDIERQLRRLVHPGFVRSMGTGRIAALDLYLRAIALRLDRWREHRSSDLRNMAEIHRLEARYLDILGQRGRQPATPPLVEAGWLLEDLRVAVFAQTLTTPALSRRAGSVKKVEKVLTTLARADIEG